MAPWPEQGNELKSIDKVNEIRSSSFDETQHQSKSDHLDDKGKTAKAEDSQDPQVLCLDEGQLKALLDEAITYKNPKDREGKSELFKELLQEVEADDKSTPGAGAGAQGANAKNPIHSATSNARFNRNHRRTNQALNSSGRHISERNRSGGSLQNLVQAYATELEAGGGYSRRRGAGGGGGGSGRGNTLRGSGINVSARQREGGSLPSNVNHVQGVSGASASLFDEYKRTRDVIMPPTEDKVSSESGLCTDYSSSTNTHSRKTSSTWGDEEGIELEEMRGGGGARTYTSRATLEVCTDPARDEDVNGACGAPSTVDVDSSVLFPLKSKCSPTPFTASLSSGGDSESHAASSNSTSPSTYNYVRLSDLEYCTSSLLSSSTTRNESSGNVISTLSIPPQPISLGASGASQAEDRSSSQQSAAEFLVNSPQVSMLLAARDYHTLTPIPHGFHLSDFLSEPLHAYTSSGYISSLDKCKSGYDENGNTVSQSDRKKPRRHKAKNEKNTYLAETVDGFRGTLDLHELLQFIENEPGSKKKAKMTQQRKKTKDDSEQPKKRKGKDKLTKCNSLEEISKTKLEDLTSTPCQNQRLRPKKQVTLDDEELGWHRREEDANSVSADEALVGRKRKQEGRGAPHKERGPEGEEEFRLVQTKKHRRRKRRSSHNEQNQPDVFRTARSSPERRGARHRTSSMPPSDRSDCSDLDSVHSLPVTSQHGRHRDHSLADANHSLDGTEQANHSLDGTEQENHSPGGTGKGSRQRVTSSPSGTAHTRSNSCTFGTIPSSCSVATDTSGAKLTKAVSCHSSSMCVNETGLGGRSLTKSTPNSTLHLAGTSSTHPQPAEPGRAAPSGTHGMGNPSKSNAGAKPTSPERRRKISGGPPPSQPPEDFSSRPWAEGDYPPLPANPAHPPPASSRSDTTHSQRSSAQTLVNGLSNEEDIRNTERRRSHGPTSSGTEPIVCNGESRPAGLTGEETVETVTLSLKKNSNKHRAPSPASGVSTTVNNNNNCCDVYVEFNLPAPPPPPPVDVTVEKTVIIRSQSCTVVSESVSLVIPPPPPSSRKSSRNNHPAAGTLATTSLPPVILRDSRVHRSKKQDVSSTSRPSDLTFGFEINPSLLLTQGRSSEPPAGGKGDVCPAHHHHPSQRAQDREQRLLAECFNYTDIVNFIGNAWKDVMKELTNQKSSSSNRVDYYSHQASTPSS